MSAGAELAKRSRDAQGLPEHVEDDGVLARIAALLGPNATKAGAAPASVSVSTSTSPRPRHRARSRHGRS
jgi:hypothetical protein